VKLIRHQIEKIDGFTQLGKVVAIPVSWRSAVAQGKDELGRLALELLCKLGQAVLVRGATAAVWIPRKLPVDVDTVEAMLFAKVDGGYDEFVAVPPVFNHHGIPEAMGVVRVVHVPAADGDNELEAWVALLEVAELAVAGANIVVLDGVRGKFYQWRTEGREAGGR
jgi:hypothetical protein